MKAYAVLTTEQLEKHREILISMLGEIDLELKGRENPGLKEKGK